MKKPKLSIQRCLIFASLLYLMAPITAHAMGSHHHASQMAENHINKQASDDHRSTDGRPVATVPEPSSLSLLIMGFAGLVFWSWGKRDLNR